MIYVWGQRPYGKVDAHGDVFVVTRFSHLQFVPLFPRASFLVCTKKGHEVVMAIPLHGRSIRAGYARGWGPLAAVIGVIIAVDSPWTGAVIVALAIASTIWAWARLGRPSADARAKRDAYTPFAGIPVDIALIATALYGRDREPAQAWLAEIERRAQSTFVAESTDLAPRYRESARHESWRDVDRRPASATPECQRAALVLARLASLSPSEAIVDEALAAHERIWTNYAKRTEPFSPRAVAR